jgi:hypothetical protein
MAGDDYRAMRSDVLRLGLDETFRGLGGPGSPAMDCSGRRWYGCNTCGWHYFIDGPSDWLRNARAWLVLIKNTPVGWPNE